MKSKFNKSLRFDTKYKKAIQRGCKTQTIQRGTSLKPGETAFIDFNYTPRVSCKGLNETIEILDIKPKMFRDLNSEDAKHEGYMCKEMLKAELRDIYGDIHNNEMFYLIKFRYIPIQK